MVEQNIQITICQTICIDENGNIIPHPDAIAPLRGHYLGDQEAIRAKINKVANQTKKK